MLGLQSAISIFMLAIVLIVYFQNQQMESRSNIYPRSEILVLQRLGLESIRSRHDTLRTEFANIPGVENVTFSSQVPYEQNHSGMSVGAVAGDKTSSFMIMRIRMDEYFLDSYNIPLLAGRNFDREISTDMFRDDAQSVNVIVNEMALEKLGFGSPANSIGRVFYQFLDDHEEKTGPSLAFTIVGVVPSQNFQGFHNRIKPTTYLMDPNAFINASVRVKGVDMQATLKELESVWDGLVPDYPMQSRYLDGIFDDFYKFFAILSGILSGFAFLALALSSIGLFGLAAYMVQGRTKEIGLRKVMGANLMQITRLLIWQFSKPVMWAMVVALPAAYFGSNIYLNFFADRLNLIEGIILAAGLVAVVFSWAIVALHAVKVARSNPIIALRYE
jgi:putative ABC transport system permease protein